MKVKELYIKKYHQFEDFKLDLTYPEGHQKAGLPLDKVCFIGQSGTGKTSLLEIIDGFVKNCYSYNLAQGATYITNGETINKVEILKNDFSQEGIRIILIDSKLKIKATHLGNCFEIRGYTMEYYPPNWYKKDSRKYISDRFHESSPISITFPVNFTNNTAKLDSSYNGKDSSFLNFGGDSYSEIWHKINQKITVYRESQIQKSLAISEITNKVGFKAEEILEAANKYKEWEQNNPNPLQDLADRVLDKILNKFNLRVRTRLDFEKIEDVKTIKIENLEGQEVPYDFQSTGTRQIFLSMLPLYTLKPNRTAIFFDEPERSLYPDIQKEIVDFYTSLTTDCQFFYATHSPIIASSFEPWEIVELKFNPKTGKVVQELYYEGERHVDNYTINPQYLRWDDILQRVFDLDSEGNEKRVKALMKLATLESKLKKKNLSPEERETLWNEYLKLSKLTGWTTRITDEKN
jgi:predicted ATPase